jgi:hypothetical protein
VVCQESYFAAVSSSTGAASLGPRAGAARRRGSRAASTGAADNARRWCLSSVVERRKELPVQCVDAVVMAGSSAAFVLCGGACDKRTTHVGEQGEGRRARTNRGNELRSETETSQERPCCYPPFHTPPHLTASELHHHAADQYSNRANCTEDGLVIRLCCTQQDESFLKLGPAIKPHTARHLPG